MTDADGKAEAEADFDMRTVAIEEARIEVAARFMATDDMAADESDEWKLFGNVDGMSGKVVTGVARSDGMSGNGAVMAVRQARPAGLECQGGGERGRRARQVCHDGQGGERGRRA
jgi:hypothetical protein